MTYQFNHESRQITLDLNPVEFDMIMVLRNAAIRYIAPLNPGSTLGCAVNDLDRINRELTYLRTQ